MYLGGATREMINDMNTPALTQTMDSVFDTLNSRVDFKGYNDKHLFFPTESVLNKGLISPVVTTAKLELHL